MELVKREELIERSYVVESRAAKLGNDELFLLVGVKLQESGRLYRKAHIGFDGTNILKLKKDLENHVADVIELAAALTEVMEWCNSRRKVSIDRGKSLSFTRVTLQEWPIMFYATHDHNRITIHVYGRDLKDARFAFRTDKPETYMEWKASLASILANFWTHIEEVENLKMADLLQRPRSLA